MLPLHASIHTYKFVVNNDGTGDTGDALAAVEKSNRKSPQSESYAASAAVVGYSSLPWDYRASG